MYSETNDGFRGAMFVILSFMAAIVLCVGSWMWLHQTWTYKATVSGDFKITAETSYQEYENHRYSTSTCVSRDKHGSCTMSVTTWHDHWDFYTKYTTQNFALSRAHDSLECNYDRKTDGVSNRWTACDVNHWMYVTYQNNEKDAKEAWCKRNTPDWKWIEAKSKIEITEDRLMEVDCK